jgi:hypothetical protein
MTALSRVESSVPRSASPAPIEHKEVLTLREAKELGYGCERTLRGMIQDGRLKQCVLRVGRKGYRLLRAVLIEELRNPRTT